MTTIRYIEDGEAFVPKDHPTMDDTLNRALKDVLTASGLDPAAAFAGFATAADRAQLQSNIDAEAAARDTAVTSEAATRASADTSEAATRATADTAESSARATGDTNAINTAAADATSKADAAQAAAIASASADATAKADAAQAAAISAADADATSKVAAEATDRADADTALAASVSSEATARASGDSDAIAAAATDATSKADAAQTAAIAASADYADDARPQDLRTVAFIKDYLKWSAKHNPRDYQTSGAPMGVGDDGPAINAMLTAAKTDGVTRHTELPEPAYTIETPIVATGAFSLKGGGRRATVITAAAAIDMFTVDPGGTSFLSALEMGHFKLDGNSIATAGLKLRYVNFAEIRRMEIINVVGTGASLDTLQDCEFYGLDVRKCGDYATQKPGVAILGFDDASGLSNSMVFFGGDIERNRYTGLTIGDKVAAVRFFGTKFHGRTTTDDAAPNAVDLITNYGGRRIKLVGCQISNVRRYGVVTGVGATVTNPDITISDCDFSNPINYQGGEAWNVVVESGALAWINGNNFADGADATYATSGGDIDLQSGATIALGMNLHKILRSRSDGGIRRNAAASRIQPIAFFDFMGASGASAITWRRTGDTGFRYDFGDNGVRGTAGDGTADSGVQRAGVSRTKVLAGTSMETNRVVTTVEPMTQTGGGTLAIVASSGSIKEISVTDTTAFAIGAPSGSIAGQELVLIITNNSGGTMGTVTFNAVFHMEAFTKPASGKSVTLRFYRSSASTYIQIGKQSGDIG